MGFNLSGLVLRSLWERRNTKLINDTMYEVTSKNMFTNRLIYYFLCFSTQTRRRLWRETRVCAKSKLVTFYFHHAKDQSHRPWISLCVIEDKVNLERLITTNRRAKIPRNRRSRDVGRSGRYRDIFSDTRSPRFLISNEKDARQDFIGGRKREGHRSAGIALLPRTNKRVRASRSAIYVEPYQPN